MAKSLEGSTDQVVSHIKNLIERGNLRPGDRLPAERDLAVKSG
jgi:DNA-binding FadR family transcriptional regulator